MECRTSCSDQSYTYYNPDRTNYYEDYRGRWKLTFPDGRILHGIKPKERGIGKKCSLLTLTLLATPQPLNLAAIDVPLAEAKEGKEQDSQMCGA